MQEWKETPRIFAVCCLDKFQKDFCKEEEKEKKIFFIRLKMGVFKDLLKTSSSFRSVVERFDEETPICVSEDYDQDCFSLTNLQKHLQLQSSHQIATLTFLTNLASIFNRFQTQG